MNATKYPTRRELIAMCDEANMEVFYRDALEARDCRKHGDTEARTGWHYWHCFPCCLPEGDAVGPFGSALAALRDAYDMGFIGDTD